MEFIKGVEKTDKEFDVLIQQIDDILKQNKEFTSPTFCGKGLLSVNGLNIIPMPKQEVFIELLKPLNIIWVDCEIKVNTEI